MKGSVVNDEDELENQIESTKVGVATNEARAGGKRVTHNPRALKDYTLYGVPINRK